MQDGTGYILLWSGKNMDEHCLSSAGFMINTYIARKLENLPTDNSDHPISLRLPTQDKFATVIGGYTPTLQAETGVKALYRNLHNHLQPLDSKDKILSLGDFNAREGRDL